MSEVVNLLPSTAASDLMVVRQLPIIEEQLWAIKEEVETRVGIALSLACTDETVQTVKKERAELNRLFQDMEERRKAIKTAVLAPYEQFEATYKECVSNIFKRGDAELKRKIDTVMTERRQEKEQELAAYFAEYAESCGVSWLNFCDAGPNVTLSSSMKKLKEEAAAIIDGVVSDMDLIGQMEDAAEIMAEYREHRSLSRAMATVQERRRRIEQEQERRAERQRATEERQEAVARVAAFAPPTQVAPEQKEKAYQCTFSVLATKTQLKTLKDFMLKEGIEIL